MTNCRKSQRRSSPKKGNKGRRKRHSASPVKEDNENKDAAAEDNSKLHDAERHGQLSVGRRTPSLEHLKLSTMPSASSADNYKMSAMAPPGQSVDKPSLSTMGASGSTMNKYLLSAMGATAADEQKLSTIPGNEAGYTSAASAAGHATGGPLDIRAPSHSHVNRLKKTGRMRKREKKPDSNQICKQKDDSTAIAREKSKIYEIEKEAEDIFRGMTRANIMYEWPLKCALGIAIGRLKVAADSSEELTPFKFFCRSQVVLWLQTIRDLLERRAMIYLDLEEMFISLFELHLVAEKKYPLEAHYVAAHVKGIATDFSYLAAFMARLSNVETFDFLRIGESLNTTPPESTPYSHLIPRMKDFKLHHLIALGRCSRVYKVTHRISGTVCAMDISTVTSERDLIAAGAVLSLISHCCVATPFARFQAGGQMVSLFEYCWGPTLENVVAESSFLSVDTFRAISAQLISGVKHIHAAGMLHRSLTTDNIVMERTGRVKIVGFHNACICLAHIPKRSQLLYQERRAAEFSYDVDFIVPVQYMSPEMVLKKAYGRASDWWSLGVTLYRTLTKSYPFDGTDEAEIRRAIHRNALSFPDRDGVPVSVGAREFLQCLLTKGPRSRCLYGDRVDLYKHPFIVGVDWKKLSSSEKLFPQPDGYCKILQRTVPARFRRADLTDSEQAALSPKAGLDDSRTNKLGDPTELEDVPYPQVSTFISTIFRKVLEVGKMPKRLGKGPLLKVMGYNAMSPALSIPDTFDLDRYNAERMVINIPKRNILELGIHIESAIGEDDSRYFYVTRFSDSFHHDSLPLIEGDVLLGMNDTAFVNEPMATVKAKLSLHQQNVTAFVVQAASPFRLAAIYPDFGSLLRALPRITVKIPPGQLLDFGALVRTQIFGYSDGWVINAAHFVWKTSGRQSLYVGDVIQTLDGVEAITLSTEEVDARLQRGASQVEVIPMSSLRTRRITVDRIFRAYGGPRELMEPTSWVKVQKECVHLTPKETAGLGPLHQRYIARRMELANRDTEPLEVNREPHRPLDGSS